MPDIHSLKLVIWDLDGTFWKGTLSEGGVEPILGNNSLLASLSEHGIINSICSKNDEGLAKEKLELFGVSKWFVFNSIDWTPKGGRIKSLIKRIGLRPENCLFIDDNPLNLAEASSFVPGLQVATPAILPVIQESLDSFSANDKDLIRLGHYRNLEKRKRAEATAPNNESFLFDAEIAVHLEYDCISHKDRILELILRTNQLNFTKKRIGEEELDELLSNEHIRCGTVHVADRFGDYGIAGFFAQRDGYLEHFLFSCRILGLGVEQYVFALLGHPQLIIQSPVVSQVNDGPAPAWINTTKTSAHAVSPSNTARIIFKGNCELKQMAWYLDTTNVKEEFAYVNQLGQNIEFSVHSVNYLSFPFLSQQQKDFILRECVFADGGMFESDIYSPGIALILLSTMPEANLGVYQHKQSGIKIAFGEQRFPLTDPENWDGYIQGKIFSSGNVFTREWLECFSSEWLALGALSPEEIAANAQSLLSKIDPHAKVCYILGSELPFLGNKQPNYEGRHLVHAEINHKMRLLAEHNDRIALIDVNDYIRSQRDFTDNINHFQRRVYYDMAMAANSIIAECIGAPLANSSRFYLWNRCLADKLSYTGIFQSKWYSSMQRWMKKK